MSDAKCARTRFLTTISEMTEFPDEPPSALTAPPDALTASPRQRRRAWILVLVVLCIAVGLGTFLYMRDGTDATAQVGDAAKGKGKGKGGPNANRPVPILAAPARTADVGVYLSGLGTVTPLATVTVRSRVDGQLMRVLFREGQVVKEGELLAEIDPRPFQAALTQAEGQIERDQAQLANARIDLERYKTLLAQDSIAKQQVDTQDALVRQYSGAVVMDRGVVDNARLQLAYSKVAS